MKCPNCGGELLDGFCPSECRDEDCYYCPKCEREYSNEDLDTNSVAYFDKLAIEHHKKSNGEA